MAGSASFRAQLAFWALWPHQTTPAATARTATARGTSTRGRRMVEATEAGAAEIPETVVSWVAVKSSRNSAADW